MDLKNILLAPKLKFTKYIINCTQNQVNTWNQNKSIAHVASLKR